MMSSLMSLAPRKAVIAETGLEVDVDEVMINTVVSVKAGESIPIDGVVVDGSCDVDEKTLTGESFPVSKQRESTVLAATINLNGTKQNHYFSLPMYDPKFSAHSHNLCTLRLHKGENYSSSPGLRGC